MKPQFKIEKVDTGRCIIVYKTKNPSNQTIYYGLLQDFDTIRLYRCSQPFKEFGEFIYEPESEATIKNQIEIELPTGDSELEIKVRDFIQSNPLMKGF